MSAEPPATDASAIELLEQAVAHRARAAEMRERASTLRSDQARASLLDVASSYEFLADTLEREAKAKK